MELTQRETWTVIYGMVLGALFLLAFAGGLAGLYSVRPELVTVRGLRERIPRLEIGTWVMALVAWLTVVSGTWIVYPWYRDPAKTSPHPAPRDLDVRPDRDRPARDVPGVLRELPPPGEVVGSRRRAGKPCGLPA